LTYTKEQLETIEEYDEKDRISILLKRKYERMKERYGD